MTKYDELKAQYNQIIQDAFKKNESIIIESFVEYYGEEYRSLIEKRYKEITFVYYIDWEMMLVIINDFIPKCKNPRKYQIFKDFYQAYQENSSLVTSIFNRFIKRDPMPTNYVGTTNASVVTIESIYKWLLSRFKLHDPRSNNFLIDHHTHRLINFPILFLDDLTILHELHHALTRDFIADIVQGHGPIYSLEKIGIEVQQWPLNDEEVLLDELLHEKSTIEILDIFKRRGGDFSSFCYAVPFRYPYRENFYLIDDFYEGFKPFIKKARISENKNALVERIGKEEYGKFRNVVNECFSIDKSVISHNKEEMRPLLKLLLNEMLENKKNSKPLSKEGLDTYYEELRNAGYSVTVLNEFQEEAYGNEEVSHRKH